MKVAVATSERGDSHAAGATAADTGAESYQKPSDRHQPSMIGDGLRKRGARHRLIAEGRSDQAGHDASGAYWVGARVRRQEPADNAANSGDAPVERHQHYGGDADQRAATPKPTA